MKIYEQNSSKIEEIVLATLSYNLLRGLKQLHQQNIYHGNIKLENVIICQNNKVNGTKN